MIDENDEEEIIPMSASPLPYIQCGMKLRDPLDGTTRHWTVADIYERGEATVADLTSNDPKPLRVTMPCPTLRHRWRLACDFDPSWGDDTPGTTP